MSVSCSAAVNSVCVIVTVAVPALEDASFNEAAAGIVAGPYPLVTFALDRKVGDTSVVAESASTLSVFDGSELMVFVVFAPRDVTMQRTFVCMSSNHNAKRVKTRFLQNDE